MMTVGEVAAATDVKLLDEKTASGTLSREEATADTPERKIEAQSEIAPNTKPTDEKTAFDPSSREEATADTPEPRNGTGRGYGTSWVAGAIRAARPKNEDRPEAAPDTKLLDEGAASGKPSREEETVTLSAMINDEYFIQNLERLKELRSFLI